MSLRRVLVSCLVLAFSLLLVLQPIPFLAPSSALAATVPPKAQAVPQVAAPKAACSAAQLDLLSADMNQARGGWINRLSPAAYDKFQAARTKYVKYATRCAKRLGLDLASVFSGVTAYDAPAGAVGGRSGGGYVPRNPNAGTYVPPQAAVVPYSTHTTEATTISGIVFSGTTGTAAPPATLGTYAMTAFPDDPRAEGTSVPGVNSPLGGAVEFSGARTVQTVGSGWGTWSHGYTGDVYFALGTSMTLYMPPKTQAFYFYAQSNDLASFDFIATANDGTSSYPVSVTSPSGAKYFGFYSPVGVYMSSISVSCTGCGADGFAVGEFGIHQNSGADLRVTKFSEPHDVVMAGDIFTYTIFVDNLGPDIANQVVISDTLLNSGDISIQSCAFSVSQGGGAITQFSCTTGPLVSTQFGSDIGTFSTNFLDPLSPDSQGRLRASFRLVANIPIDVTNTTRVTSNTFDPNLNNNFAVDTLSVTAVSDLQGFSTFGAEVQTNGLIGKVVDTNTLPAMPDPSCCNFGGTTVTAGRRIQWDTSVINAGPSDADNVRIEVALPFGATIIENTLTGLPTAGQVAGRCSTEPAGALRTKVICIYPTMTLSQNASLRFQVLVDPALPSGTQLSFDAVASSEEYDSNYSNNITSIQFDSNAWADLAISKTANGAAVTDSTLYYQYDITNKGPSWSRDVTLRDDLPDEVDFVNAFIDPEGDGDANPLQCTVQAGNLLCPLGDLKPTGTQPVRVFANVHIKAGTPDGTNITNTADFLMDTQDPFLSDNTDTVIIPVAAQDLILTKTAPTEAGAGEYITYVLEVNNDGPLQAEHVRVLDYLPAQLKLLTLTPDQGSCEAGVEGDPLRPAVCDLGSIPSNTIVNVTVEGQVRSEILGDVLLFNDAQVSGDVPETTLANNIDSVTTAVVATCGVLPTKPVAISPPDGMSSLKASNLLDWSDVNCAITYGVTIRQDAIASPNFFKTKKLLVSQYKTEKFPRGHDYYWRGLACNGVGCKRTDWFKFTVELVP